MKEMQYRQKRTPINSKLTVVQDLDYRWGVIDFDGNIIVPFGKYAWIDGFQNGLAKVIGHKDTTSPNTVAVFGTDFQRVPHNERVAEQGIINEEGTEVLPLEFNVWKFYGKDFSTIKYFKKNEEFIVRFETLNPELVNKNIEDNHSSDYYDGSDYNDYMRDTWDAMTDGMYGDMPEGFDGDYDFLGF